MLVTLTVRDLALVEHAQLDFRTGMHVLSGQTGGGKSLVIAALGLLRGGRAKAGMVRQGADHLRVDGEFQLGTGERSASLKHRLGQILDVPEDEVIPDDELLVVTRIIDKNGRSRVRVAGRPTTLGALKELGAWLLEIHGQGESRALMRPEIQIETLDAFAGLSDLRRQFAGALRDAKAARDAHREACEEVQGRQQQLEFLRFQVQELDALGLSAGETSQLEREHGLLAHVDRQREHLADALAALQDNEPSAGDLLAQGERALAAAAEIDPGLKDALARLSEARELVADAARDSVSAQGDLELDPARMEAVEARMAEIQKVLRRFGPTEADLLAHLGRVRAELDQLDDPATDPDALAQAADAARDHAMKVGRKLHRARAKAAGPFTEAVQRELADLEMPRAQLRVEQGELPAPDGLLEGATAHGPVATQILVCTNPGEPFLPLGEIASGGELARAVLAIKKILADQDRVPLLVFDEIDSEIGGRLGLQVGAKLAEVAAHHQVMIVTHLPQVAAFADVHWMVAKEVAGQGESERTLARVTALDQQGAQRELAAMAGGDAEGAVARATLDEAMRLRERARGGRSSGRRGKPSGKGSSGEASPP